METLTDYGLAITWQTEDRAEITFSHDHGRQATLEACEAAKRVIERAGHGWTMRHGQGGWDGGEEDSLSLIVCGAPMGVIAWAIRALHSCGCVAVQLETWQGGVYQCGEIKRVAAVDPDAPNPAPKLYPVAA